MYSILDSGETQKYIKVHIRCTNKVKIYIGPQVLLPDGSLMPVTHREDLNLTLY